MNNVEKSNNIVEKKDFIFSPLSFHECDCDKPCIIFSDTIITRIIPKSIEAIHFFIRKISICIQDSKDENREM